MYFDEQRWKKLDPAVVEFGEQTELERKLGVCENVPRQGIAQDHQGEFVKVKWVRAHSGSDERREFQCHLVAPELVVVELWPSVAAEQGFAIMVLDVKCAFLFGEIRGESLRRVSSPGRNFGRP